MSHAIWAKHFVLWLVAATAVTGAARAQVSSPKTSPQLIVLPLELVSGQPATLAILSADGRIAAGVKLVLSNGEVVSTDESGRAHFLAPPDAGILIVRIPGTEVRATADVTPQEGAEKLEIARAPAIVALKYRFTVDGSGFSGDADRNQVELDGKRVLVLAASPKELVIVAPPTTAPGRAPLALKTGSSEASVKITFVNVSPDALSDAVKPGKKAKLVLHVSGTTQPVQLDVQNMSPRIVGFKHGERERLRTHGGPDNSATIEVKGLHVGNFSYAVTFQAQPGAPNVRAARDFLQAADKLAAGDTRHRIESVLKKLRRQNPDIRGARREFARVRDASTTGDLQALIRAAGEALSGEPHSGRERINP